MDLALTRFLLGQPGGGAYESNPFASWWLANFGWWGLVLLKVGIVLLMGSMTLAVSRRRPRVAGWVLGFGCTALLGVLVYSGLLVPEVLAQADQTRQREQRSQQLEGKCVPLQAYLDMVGKLRKDLVLRRRSLAEAVEMLSTTERVHDSEWQRHTGSRFPGYKGAEVVAALLIEEAVLSPEASSKDLLHRELEAEFRSCFGRPSPPLPREWHSSTAAVWAW
jgi:hypothetical protein